MPGLDHVWKIRHLHHFASELDFGVASSEGYFPYTESKPPISILLDSFIAAGSKPALMEFFEGEKEREAASKTIHPVSDASINVNVLKKKEKLHPKLFILFLMLL